LLAIITDPNVAYILMLLGVYGLLLEFYSPGMGIGGIVGGISLLLALYAFQVLPISYAGLALILLGIALMIGEAFAPSFGVLGLGGIAAFVMGSLMLMDTDIPAYQIALPTVIAVSVFSAALLIVSFALIMRARKQQVVSGVERLLGATGIVEKLSGAQPMVRLEGELWETRCAQRLVAEDEVVVCAIDGVTLEVKKQVRGNQDGGI
jgi:membrane-bound serine protease (ClpP class)